MAISNFLCQGGSKHKVYRYMAPKFKLCAPVQFKNKICIWVYFLMIKTPLKSQRVPHNDLFLLLWWRARSLDINYRLLTCKWPTKLPPNNVKLRRPKAWWCVKFTISHSMCHFLWCCRLMVHSLQFLLTQFYSQFLLF